MLIFSVIIHEISHGYVAERLGDPTARNAGRLTLNPMKHLDPMGSFIVPLGLFLLTRGAFVFGWAKPVPYNPAMLKDRRWGAAKIAAAGPVSNFLIAIVFGLLLRGATALDSIELIPLSLLFALIIYLNILLAIFNLVPIPPLDGSKVLFALLPPTESNFRLMGFLNRYGFFVLLLFIFFGFSLIIPIIDSLFFLIAGQPFGI